MTARKTPRLRSEGRASETGEVSNQGYSGFAATVFQAFNDPNGARLAVDSWDSFRDFLRVNIAPNTVEKKALLLYASVSFRDDRRDAAHVIEAHTIGFDIDEDPIPSEAEVVQAFEDLGLKALVLSTSRSLPGAPRWRAHVALCRPVQASEYRRLWRGIESELPFKVGQEAKDPCRQWYWPQHPKDGAFVCRETTGNPLEVDELLPLLAYEDPSPVARGVVGTNEGGPLDDRAIELLGNAWPARGRHEAQKALAGALIRDGRTETDAVSILCRVCRVAGEEDRPKRAATVRDAVKRFEAGATIFGWTELANHVDPGVCASARNLFAGNSPELFDMIGRLKSTLAEASPNDSTSEIEPLKEYLQASRQLTDTGNAERFAKEHRDSARYVPAWKSWLVWDGKRWTRDDAGKVYALAKATTLGMWRELGDPYAFGNEGGSAEDARKRFSKWVLYSDSSAGREHMVQMARHELPISAETLDQDGWVLNVANGTIDLKTGCLRPYAREDLITKVLETPYDPGASCPLFMSFLHRVMAGNEALVGFLQRAIGYSLTGNVGEHCLFFLLGDGANGKSTLTGAIRDLLGPYAKPTAPGLLLAKKNGDDHPTEIADIFGVRFALSQEVDRDRAWSEARLKYLTGGDEVSARRMHQDWWTFKPTHKFWICANHRPRVQNDDEGIWRRMKLVPFNVQIPQEERDTELSTKLRAELPGILAWAVRGCLEWQRVGLQTPPEVKRATAAYRTEMDHVARFLEDRCEQGPSYDVAAKEIFDAYSHWCGAEREVPISKTDFGTRLTRSGFEADKRPGGVRIRKGVRVRPFAGVGG